MKIHLRILLPILAALGTLPANAFTSNWNISTVDAAGTATGGMNSLALGSNGAPAIAYLDGTNEDLKFAAFNGTSWVLSTVDSAGSVGYSPSLAINALDRPAISYTDFTNFDLKYAAFNGTTWAISIVDSEGNVGSYSSLAFRPGNLPAISYLDATNQDLKYAAFNGASWVITTVDTAGVVGSYSSLAFDSAGHPGIAYYDTTNQAVKYASFNGTTWTTTTVTSASIHSQLSLAIDGADHPSISYQENNATTLKYAAFDGTNWTVTTVAPSCSLATSLALTSTGLPRIAYLDVDGKLKYAAYDGSVWSFSAADNSGGAGSIVSLKLDASDTPSISYWDQTNDILKYATLGKLPPPPVTNGITVAVTPGQRRATFTVKNTGGATATIRLAAAQRVNNSFSGRKPSRPTRNDNIVTYTRGGANITRDLVAGNVSVSLAAGASTRIDVKVSTRASLKFKRALHVTLTAASVAKSASAEAILTLKAAGAR